MWFARLVRRWRWLTRCAVRDFRELYRRAERERFERAWHEWCWIIACSIAGSVITYLIWG